MSASSAAYDVVPYDDRPVVETHVDRLCIAARLAGIDAPAPERARVLELGCAHAVNLLPQAAALPGARFVGVDLSPRQIEVAARRVRATGLTNVRVIAADVMDLDLGDERFDYVVAHGLLSWVPDVVRDRVLALARAVLAPNGVAYVSYNAMPAWGIRGAVRRALLETCDVAEDCRDRVRLAREALAVLRSANVLEGTAEGALMSAEIDSLADKPDAYLLHEYLVPFARAYWVREMFELAEGAGLRYLDDVAPPSLPYDAMVTARERVAAITRDPIRAEQLVDVVTFRQFRATLWCRDDAARDDPPRTSETVRASFVASDPGAASSDDPIVASLRARWPSDVPFSELATDETDRDALAARVLDAHRRGDVLLSPRALAHAPTISARPALTTVARLEAKELGFVTTPRHAYAPIDPFHAALAGHLDGTCTRDELVAALADDLRSGRLRGGGASPDRIVASLPRLVDSGLRLLHGAGLVVA